MAHSKEKSMPRLFLFFFLAAVSLTMSGCSSMYYNTMETFGKHKRDILADRVVDARDEQEEAKEEFADALQQFKAVLNFEGGKLEQNYNKLNSEYEDCRDRAESVRDRIDSIEDVATALFKEWEKELDDYKSAELRRSSERQLRATRAKYDNLITAMRRVEQKMDPVLDAFHDQVLFLKHNLNAQAIASLEGNLAGIQQDVDILIAEMEQSIAEANAFLDEMELAND